MKEIIDKIIEKDFELRSILVKDEIYKESKENDNEEIEYVLNAKYRIIDNKPNAIVIRVNTNSFFTPNAIFKADMEFNVFLGVDGELKDEDIHDNIEEILSPLASEISCLLATIIKSMKGRPLILPPVINKIEQ